MSKLESFFVITQSDGAARIENIDRATLTKRLEDNYYGEKLNFLSETDIRPAAGSPKCDPNYWDHGDVLIIRGKAATPKIVTKVVKYELDE